MRHEVSGAVKVVAHYEVDDAGDLPAWRVYGLGDVGARARAAAERRVAAAHDDDLELTAEERAEMVARSQRAVMYVPIVVSDQVVGFLCAIDGATRAASPTQTKPSPPASPTRPPSPSPARG